MDKNRIEGRPGEASWHNTAKPSDPVREVNAAVVRRRTAFLPGEIPTGQPEGKSAEAIVPGREPGAGDRPLKQRNRKTRGREGPNWRANVQLRGGCWD